MYVMVLSKLYIFTSVASIQAITYAGIAMGQQWIVR